MSFLRSENEVVIDMYDIGRGISLLYIYLVSQKFWKAMMLFLDLSQL